MTKEKTAAVAGFIAAVILMCSFSAHCYAQTKEIVHDNLTEFDSVDISYAFEATVSEGPYGVKVIVENTLAPYVEVYVKGKTLYVGFDAKSVPADIKKLYKNKKTPTPVFKAIITTRRLEKVNVTDYATLTGTSSFEAGKFELTAFDKAQVKDLSIVASSARFTLKKNAYVNMSLDAANDVDISADGASDISLKQSSRDLTITVAGSASVSATGDTKDLNISAAGSSEVRVISNTTKVDIAASNSSRIVLSGSAESLLLKSANSAFIDANEMPVQNAEVTMTNTSSFNVNVSKTLGVNLNGGSQLYFTGKPEFKIDKIVKSTLAPYASSK